MGQRLTIYYRSQKNPQGFFQRFFDMGTLLLAPLHNLDEISVSCGHLVALPMKIEETCAAPARVLLVEE